MPRPTPINDAGKQGGERHVMSKRHMNHVALKDGQKDGNGDRADDGIEKRLAAEQLPADEKERNVERQVGDRWIQSEQK